jgi:hypothetical protein
VCCFITRFLLFQYWEVPFGCPGIRDEHPPLEFTCQERVFQAILAQELTAPVGSRFLYSDISFITLMYVVGARAQALGYVTPAELDSDCAAAGGSNPGGAIWQCYYAMCAIYIYSCIYSISHIYLYYIIHIYNCSNIRFV